MSKNSEVIFDLDGTLANLDHRLPLIQGEKKYYDEFYEACDNDSPIESVASVARALHSSGYKIRIITGRSEVVAEKTRKWLLQHMIPCDEILMRPEGDYRPDYELKKEWSREKVSLERTLMVFEDRTRVVEMWRQWGFTCCQVAKGDF